MLEQRKLVTVLFADVIGSAALSKSLDPERLRTVLDAYFKAMAKVIAVWGSTVEKFIGDAIVAVFGVPTVREDDAARALRAGLEMLTRVDQLNGHRSTPRHAYRREREGPAARRARGRGNLAMRPTASTWNRSSGSGSPARR